MIDKASHYLLRPKSDRFKGLLLAIIGSMFYGLNPLFALPLYAEGMEPLAVLFYRYLFACVLIAAVMLYKREGFSLSKTELLPTLLMGTLFSVSSITLFLSFKEIDAGIASTILFTYPLFVALMMWLFFKEKAGRITLVSLALAIAGIAFLYQTGSGTLSTTGIVFVLLSSLSYAIYIIGVNRSVLRNMSSLKLVFYAMLTGVVLFFALLKFGKNLPPLSTPTMWINTMGLALFPTVMSLVFVTRSIRMIGSTPASIIGALEPLTALAISILVFGGSLTLMNCIGIVLILFSVMLIVLGDKRR